MKAEGDGIKRYLVSVAVTLTVVLLTQTGALLYWCGKINTEIANLKEVVAKCCP